MDRGETLRRIAECQALCKRAEPMTAAQRAEFNTLRAREMARAEARRQPPQPQLQLGQVAR